MSLKLADVLTTKSDLENLSIFEVSLARSPANLEDGFLLKKNMSDHDQSRGDDSVKNLEDLEFEKLSELAEEDRASLVSALVETFEKDDLEEILEGNVFEEFKESVEKDIREEVEKEFAEKAEEEEENYGLSPKSINAIKTVLSELNEVRSEIPANFQHVFDSLATLVGYPSQGDEGSEYGYPKVAEFDLSDEAEETIENSVETLQKIEDMPDFGNEAIKILEGLAMSKEEFDISDAVSKEVEPMIKEMQEKMTALEKENEELKEKRLQDELISVVKEHKLVPGSTSEKLELFEKLHKAGVLDDVVKVFEQMEKESAAGEIFKEEGHNAPPEEEKTAQEEFDSLVKEKMEDDDLEKSVATEKVMEENPELFFKLREK